MLTREHIAELLALQSTAYALLMWLGEASARHPAWLSPAMVALLHVPETAVPWLEQQRETIPARLLPADLKGAFTNLFCSFFATSFRVRHLAFEGRLLDARLMRGVSAHPPSRLGVEHCQALALKHLAAGEKLPITEPEAQRLVRRTTLREPALLWTYVWELDRRARNKGKGPVAHRIWRSLPGETRRSLDVEQVWAAREQLLEAVRRDVL